MHQFLTDILKLVLDTIFPIYCLTCKNQSSQYFCLLCVKLLDRLPTQLCIVCRKPSVAGFTHPLCRSTQSPEAIISIYDYHDKYIAKAIIVGKYKFVRQIYKELGAELSEYLLSEFPFTLENADFISPVPLNKARQRWRGFNQAEILAQALSEKSNIPIFNLLIRKKNTKTQKDLPLSERLKNVRDAFIVTSTQNLSNKNILLIDDVCTTGATLRQAAKALKKGGANRVTCITLAAD